MGVLQTFARMTTKMMCPAKKPVRHTPADLKTGKKEKVQCKNPPKQKLPPKLSMAQLVEVCGLLDENGFPYRRAETDRPIPPPNVSGR